MKKAFTLVELLVVIGMLAILIGAVGSGVNKARSRSMVAKATQDVKEMTNAIGALANYTDSHTLQEVAEQFSSWTPTTESSLSLILGGSLQGRQLPVLYNAQIRGSGDIVDPWGNKYEIIVKKANTINPNTVGVTYKTAATMPNFYRLTDKERQ